MKANLYPDYKQAVAEFLAMNLAPGEMVSHDWLDEHLRLDRQDRRYQLERLKRFNEFRSCLLVEHKIHLQNIFGKGYMVIAPNEQTNRAMDDVSSRVQTAISVGLFRLTNVAVDKLTDVERQNNVNALTRLAGLGSMVHKQITGK